MSAAQPTREEFLAVTRDITANVERMIGMLLDEPPEARVTAEDAETAYQLGYDAGCRAGFPPVPPCPSWCDQQHGQRTLGGDDWESIDKRGIEVSRCHAHHVGDVAGKVGVDIVADTTAQRGTEPFTSQPVLSVWTGLSGAELNGSEVRDLARLMVFAADELEYRVLGGEQ